MASWIGIVLFVVGLGAAIALHEWGHLVTAKRFGMRADRYFIGFGPTLWSTRRGETEYGVKALLFGGFVRIRGMTPEDERLLPVAVEVFSRQSVAAERRASGGDLLTAPAVSDATWARLGEELEVRGVPAADRDRLIERTRAEAGSEPTAEEAASAFVSVATRMLPDTGRVGDLRHRVLRGDEDRFFHDRPPWQRAIVLFAGSGMHFVIAIALLFAAFWAFDAIPTTTVEAVMDGTPAATAGIEPGEQIIAVDGEPVTTFEDARELISTRPGEAVVLTLARDGATREVTLRTALVVAPYGPSSPLAGSHLLPNDRLLTAAGAPVATVADLRAAVAGGAVELSVERLVAGEDGGPVPTVETVVLTEEMVEALAEGLVGLAGFIPAEDGVGVLGALERTFVGEGSFPSMVVMTFEAFGGLLGPDGLGALPAQLLGAERDITGSSLASPVGLAQIAGQGTSQSGLFFLFGILAAINVFIGIFNLLPLPPLDGGHLAVLGVERGVNVVRSLRGLSADYRVDPRAFTAVAVPVIVLLGVVFLAVLVLDITNPLRLPQ